MSAHTPGPWRNNNGSISGHGWTNFAFVVTDLQDEPDEVGIANARLIAAAPDLLAALEGVLRVADRQTTEFDAARAAIKKATGDSK